jgi:hypothetical protein
MPAHLSVPYTTFRRSITNSLDALWAAYFAFNLQALAWRIFLDYTRGNIKFF